MNEHTHHFGKGSCFLCGDLEDRGGAAGHLESLRVVADRSPLCEGHFLLSPIEHELSFAAYLDAQESTPPIRALVAGLVGQSRHYLLLENGSSPTTQFCGTEHAHLHVLPCETIVRNAQEIVESILSQLIGDYHITAWWPDSHVMREGKWTGYIHISSSDVKYTRTIYLRKPQRRQLSRSAIAGATGRPAYLYDETVDLPAARTTTARLRARMEGCGGGGPADITLIEGLSGSGKSSVVNHLAQADGHLAIRTGAAFCALANAYGDEPLTATPNALRSMLLRLREPYLAESEIDERLRSKAAVIAADGQRWRAVMDWVWEQFRAAQPFVSAVVMEGRGFEDSRFRNVGHHYYLNAPDAVRSGRKAGRLAAELGSARDYTDKHRMVGRTSPRNGTVIETEGKSIPEICSQIAMLTRRNYERRAGAAANVGSEWKTFKKRRA